MPLTDYLPYGTYIGKPVLIEECENFSDGTKVCRQFFDCGQNPTVKFFENTFNTEEHVVDQTADYGPATYSTGDEVKIGIGLRYKYAGATDLVIDSSNEEEYHPAAVDEFGSRKNSTIWIPLGFVREKTPLNGATTSTLLCKQGARIEIDCGWTYAYGPDMFLAIFIDGLDYVPVKHPVSLTARIEIIDGSGDTQDSFSTPVVGGKLFLAVPQDQDSTTTEKRRAKISVSIDALYATSVTLATDVYIGHVSLSFLRRIGEPMYGIDERNTSTFVDVVSDGVQQEIATKSFDTISGTIIVESQDFQRAKTLLRRSARGGHMLYIGARKSEYSDLAYYGKVKYTSAIDDPSGRYKIGVSAESRPYFVSNDFVTVDSTEGYPQ